MAVIEVSKGFLCAGLNTEVSYECCKDKLSRTGKWNKMISLSKSCWGKEGGRGGAEQSKRFKGDPGAAGRTQAATEREAVRWMHRDSSQEVGDPREHSGHALGRRAVRWLEGWGWYTPVLANSYSLFQTQLQHSLLGELGAKSGFPLTPCSQSALSIPCDYTLGTCHYRSKVQLILQEGGSCIRPGLLGILHEQNASHTWWLSWDALGLEMGVGRGGDKWSENPHEKATGGRNYVWRSRGVRGEQQRIK